MKYKFLILFIFHILIPQAAVSQPREVYQPGARAAGLGGSLVAQSRDPSALFWNPALLHGLKDQKLLLNVNDVFSFNYIGYAYFLPYYGTFSAALSRIETGDVLNDSLMSVDRISAGWGRRVSGPFHFGLSLNAEDDQNRWGFSSGIGFFLGNPTIGAHGVRWRNSQHTAFWDRVSLGVTFQNIPLVDPHFDFAVLNGLSILIPEAGILLNSGYHIQKGENTTHVGIGYELFNKLAVMTGIQDFDWQQWGFNVAYEHRYFVLDLGYSRQSANLLLTLAVRLGASPQARARSYYDRGQKFVKQDSYKAAVPELRKYLSFELNDVYSDTVKAVLHRVVWRIERNRFLADSLMLVANQYISQDEPQVLRAALLYRRVVEIEPDNELATVQLAALQPAIDKFVATSIKSGRDELSAGRNTEAEALFRRAELFDPDNQLVKVYLKQLDERLKEDAEEHFFRGIGYYRQKEYPLALKAFQKAVELDPGLDEANNYLLRTEEKLVEIQEKTDRMLREAFLLEEQMRHVAATKIYLEILEIQPLHKIARSHITALKPHVARFVDEKYRLGIQAADVGDYPVAITHFRNILTIDAGHKNAKSGLRRAQADLKARVDSEMLQARIAEENRDWQTALESYSYILELEAGNRNAAEGKRRVNSYQGFDEQLKSAGQKYMLGEYHDARTEVDNVLATAPDYAPAIVLHDKIEAEITAKAEGLFNKGLGLFAEDEYQKAIVLWQQVLELEPDHALAKDYIQQANERITALKMIEK